VGHQSYQLLIEVRRPVCIRVGRLGTFRFPAGRYVYTGSATRNLEARIARHRGARQRLRWHIDFLLAAPGSRVARVRRSRLRECAFNQSARGAILVAGFGASDCRAGCGSHLKYRGHQTGSGSAGGGQPAGVALTAPRHRVTSAPSLGRTACRS
jgi:Uri superfamily endonuclease